VDLLAEITIVSLLAVCDIHVCFLSIFVVVVVGDAGGYLAQVYA